ncbi:MAG: RNA-binding transcriptional accessory protein [Paludibacteraceae bacterium]|nr:RNA-binding transcriptional accessory protein [Paludibacteraceae bacterium]
MKTVHEVIALIAGELQLEENRVAATVRLLEEGATVPFISRYRKEATGGMDELQVEEVKLRLAKYNELAARRESILNTIEEQGKLTPDLRRKIETCWDKAQLEDLYLPYKPKRKTRAEAARQAGLEPLARQIMAQAPVRLAQMAARYVKGPVPDEAAALQGARDIIAEWVSENGRVRNLVRAGFDRYARMTSRVVKGKEEEAANFRNYFDWECPLQRVASHQYLAVRRGEEAGWLRVDIAPDAERTIERIVPLFVRGSGECSRQVALAVEDSYKRLIKPSIESEVAACAKEKADAEAIRVFADNARQLLMGAPLGPKRILGLDPGFRSGCKLVCIDEGGRLLHNENIYPHPPQSQTARAAATLTHLVDAFRIDAIAIGNGTASRETERFVQQIRFPREVKVFVVSENGASVYSASQVAREEFPDYDVTVRGAVSIARRLADPLAELVKIDPKSIGVGQYQHDVDQKRLGESLTATVESVVNRVGVDLNTASSHLLTYVSGLGPALAQAIVAYRSEHGRFASRRALLEVPKLGAKTFQQAAGFLRVQGGNNPLDATAVHPESYPVVERMARDLKVTVPDLIRDRQLRQRIDLQRYVSDTVGLPTLNDILQELEKPGRDPRSELEEFAFDASVQTLDDLREGMILPGIVTNITNFGAFVDVGVHEDGLVHVSQMAGKYVSSPSEVVKLHQHVRVRVLEVDRVRKRISLSMLQVE